MVQVKATYPIVAFLLLLVIFPMSLSAIEQNRLYRFSADVAFVRDPRYAMSYQLGYSTGIGLNIGFSPEVGAALEGGVSVFDSSPFQDGVQYRGFTSVYAEALFDLSFRLGKLGWHTRGRFGARAGGRIDYAQYSLTSLYLFFPGIVFTPYFSIATSGRGAVAFRTGLPLLCFFRHDLDIFISTGISFEILI